MELTALKETLKLVCMKQPSLLIDVLKSTDGNGDLAPGNQPAVPFQPGVPTITVGRRLLRRKSVL